ncbi:ArsR/SmtB family transcription factor [Microbacterium sp. CPCC 204701]|uniref:ArsR/SmtB family transcription factor n=1 Tax=Microbacterium sp. CPCC 204701 TaxID=2493084 RepID=UPI000FD7D158|nr:helix-turn-helix domain-containing protein [Microbacterium sp. CPCC 204701]
MSSPRLTVAEPLAVIIRALANEDRLRLVREIATEHAVSACEGFTIAELATRVEISRFAASRHLGILRDAGLVCRRQVGVRSVHTLDPSGFEMLEDWLYPLIDALETRRASGAA